MISFRELTGCTKAMHDRQIVCFHLLLYRNDT
jgi:hypothetical protein